MFENPVAAIIFWTVFGSVILTIIGFLLHQFRYIIWSGYMRVVFVGEDRRSGGVILKIDESDHDFEIKMYGKVFKYGLERDRIYRSGRFRIPTAYYKIGDAEAVDMLKTGEESKVAALDYAQVARNTVTRDLIAAFDTKFLNPGNIFMLTVLIIGVGFLALGIYINNEVKGLEELHAGANPQGSVTISGGTPTQGGLLNNDR